MKKKEDPKILYLIYKIKGSKNVSYNNFRLLQYVLNSTLARALWLYNVMLPDSLFKDLPVFPEFMYFILAI